MDGRRREAKRMERWGVLAFCLVFLVGGMSRKAWGETRDAVIEALCRRIAQGTGVFDHGSRRISPPGFAITTDLCPSTRPWNRSLYEMLVDLGKKLRRPLPVGIAVSGRWMERYPGALAQLVKWDREEKLTITWINHSDTHPVKGNFLINPGVDFTREVEIQADRMRKAGIYNAPFFRFPGLVCNFTRLRQLSGMGYVAVGADAWLAKGQRVRNGSIILVHGNGNEPFGVRLLKIYLKMKEKEILMGKLRVMALGDLLRESAEVESGFQFISWVQPKSR